MKRRGPKDACALVEGAEDQMFYSRFVDGACCRIEICYGKQNVLGVLAILERTGFAGVVAIVDADYVHAEQQASTSQNLVHTDLHDLETMLVCSSALDNILIEYGPHDEHAALTVQADAVRKIAIYIAARIGFLRWVSIRDDMGLDLSSVNMVDVLADDGSLRWEALIMVTQTRSRKGVLQPDLLHVRCEELAAASHPAEQICRGHDACAVLAFYASRVWRTSHGTTAGDIERGLRLAYKESDFVETKMFRQLKNWEESNPPFKVLKARVAS
jgi:hypothetical protein